jgi:hypothetical protein
VIDYSKGVIIMSSVYKNLDVSGFSNQISLKSDNLEAATSKAQENATKANEIADSIMADFSKSSLLANISAELSKTIAHESGSFATLGRTINKGKEDMLNRDFVQAKIAEAIAIPRDFDKNDPANIEHKRFDDYLIAQMDQGRGVSDGSGDGTVKKEDKNSSIRQAQRMGNVNENAMPDESIYDAVSSIDKEKMLRDQFRPGGLEEQILDDSTRVIKQNLKDEFKDGGIDKQELDDNSRVIKANLRDVFKDGGTKEEVYDDRSSINPTELASIVNKDSLDEKEIDTTKLNSNHDRTNNGSSSIENEQAEGINEATLAEVTDALTDLGEVGTDQQIMGNELSKTVDDLTASNIAVTDLAQSIASDVVSSEVGK